MYEKYWGLQEKPFENTPDTRFLYLSLGHNEALARLSYTVRENKGAALLTGEAGCGKTLLTRALLDELGQERFRTATITNPFLTSLQLFGELAAQLGAKEVYKDRMSVMDALGRTLRHNYDMGKRCIIIVDEAHLIRQMDAFEELRVLLNYQHDQEFLLTLILVGQPELKERIVQLGALKQRISIRSQVSPLSQEEVTTYIGHRLAVAGRKEPIFSLASADLVYKYSEGVPQRINNLCDMCLLAGFVERAEQIEAPAIEKTAEELEELLF
jgi:type II secretory pathway predicted ATPase ExeA